MKRYRINFKWYDGKRRRFYDPRKQYVPDQPRGVVDEPDTFVEPPPTMGEGGLDKPKLTYMGWVDAAGTFYPGQQPQRAVTEKTVHNVEEDDLGLMTKAELTELANELHIPGISQDNKTELIRKIEGKRAEGSA